MRLTSVLLALSHSFSCFIGLFPYWTDPCSKELRVASGQQLQETEVLSPTTYKELNPANNHRIVLEVDTAPTQALR